uniref:Putative pyrophosphorylase ModD n=1 Tax=Chlorobium chlorochromatii (strain CaD3) TaxID=340177 RepID=Q3ATJ0_CHLCH
MLYQLPDSAIDAFLDEDMPYGDLTTHLLGIGNERGTISFISREVITVCCTEEAARLLERCGATVTNMVASGSVVQVGSELLVANGSAAALHAGWKVAMNLLEYASGIATRTRTIVEHATAVNPNVRLVTTRKSFPGTKKVAIKAIMAGGALPHRLGLSESVLIFRQHTEFCGGLERLLATLSSLKMELPEHKIMIEAETADEALRIAAAGADVVQLDKLPPAELQPLITKLRVIAPTITISAAGGINAQNAADYAATGVDILVLSSPYFGKPADIKVIMTSH